MLGSILFLQPPGTQESLNQQGSRGRKVATQISSWRRVPKGKVATWAEALRLGPAVGHGASWTGRPETCNPPVFFIKIK